MLTQVPTYMYLCILSVEDEAFGKKMNKTFTHEQLAVKLIYRKSFEFPHEQNCLEQSGIHASPYVFICLNACGRKKF